MVYPLSRIETNTRTPSSSVLKALLERLGLPAGQFFALLSENDIAPSGLPMPAFVLNINCRTNRLSSPPNFSKNPISTRQSRIDLFSKGFRGPFWYL